MSNYRFEPDEAVAHIENLGQKMIVKEIKRRKIALSSGKEVMKIDGIEVYWFEGEELKKTIKKEKFHSELLVPWSVAEKGKDAVTKWIAERQNFKTKQV